MRDKDKTKEQLISELEAIRRRNAELETSEAEHKWTEEKFRIIFECAPDAYYLNDLKGKFIDGNKAAERITGYTKGELLGKSFLALNMLSGNQLSKAVAALAKNVLDKPTGPDEFTLIRKDGRRIEVEIATHPIKIEGKALVLGIARDITERKRSEEALRLLESGVQNATDSIVITTVTKTKAPEIVYVNPAFTKMTGYSVEESIGKTTQMLQGPKTDRSILMKMISAILRGETFYGELINYRKDSTEFHMDMHIAPLSNEAGEITHYVSILRDITESKKVEKELVSLYRFQNEMLDTAAIWINTLDAKGHVSFWNRAAERISGYDREEVLGHDKIWEWAYPDPTYRAKINAQAMAIIRENERIENFETTIRHKDGEYRVLSWHSNNVLDEAGQIIGSIALGADVTDRKRAAEELQESEERFRIIFETSGVAIWEEDFSAVSAACEELRTQGVTNFRRYFYEHPDFMRRIAQMIKVVDVNETAVKMFGAADKQELMMSLDKIIGSETLDCIAEELLAIAEGRTYFEGETVNQTLHGKRLNVFLSMRIPREEGKLNRVLVSMIDITERVRAEEALRKSKKLFLSLIESLPQNIFSKDLEGRFTFANQRYCKAEGKTLADIQGKTDFDLHPPELAKKYLEDDRRVIETGQIFETVEIHQPETGEKFYVKVIKVPLYDVVGQVSGILGIFWDITERKRAEEALQESYRDLEAALSQVKAMQEQMLQQERLAAVGHLAAGIAHDFNNMLTGILGFAELLLIQQEIPEAARAKVKHIEQQGKRAAHLVSQILDFSRKSVPRPQQLDLVPLLEETVNLLERTIPENIHICLESEPEECPIRADHTQLQQVLTNLAVNARDAMPEGGELSVRLSRFILTADERPPCLDMPSGEWAALSLSDTGTGIPSEILPHIFEPFFTTKEVGEGTGLGLAQAYGIIKQHEGHIDVVSRKGEGTTFTLFLPVSPSTEDTFPTEELASVPRGRGETVLLVEDNPTVLEVSRMQLEHLEYRVLAAVGGEEALVVFAGHKDEIALVLADMVMPGMGGAALLKALQAKTPDIKMVVMTGYPLGEESSSLLEQGIVDWVQKPLNIAQLAGVMNRALQGG